MIQGIDPRTGAPTGGPVPVTTTDRLDDVLTAAARAFPTWSASPPATRAAFLRALADALDAAGPQLVPLAMAETGLPEARLTGEVARTTGQLRLFAEVALDGRYLDVAIDREDRTVAPPRPDLRRVREPLGPVLVFAASNFPFAFSVLGGDTASALAVGCPVVVKAHDGHPGLSVEVAALALRVALEQGLPDGVLGLVVGTDAGVEALRDSRVRAAGFTGSTQGGRALLDVASSRPDPIPFHGELGSINPVVVTPAALEARRAEILSGFVGSFTLGTGQFCTKPGLLFLPSGHGVDAELADLVTGTAPAPLLGSRIGDQLGRATARLLELGSVRTIASGAAAPTDGAWASPLLVATTADAVARDPEVLTEECFGPVAVVVEYDGPEDLHAALASVPGSLTATVHTVDDDPFPLEGVVDVLRARAGRVLFDGWPTGVAVTWAMQHGGPWPATTSPGHTSVGASAVDRWVRPVTYQSAPERFLPPPLLDANPWRVPRRVDGVVENVS